MLPRQEEPAVVVCSGCQQELCPACGACLCFPEMERSCQRAEHWRPENRS